MEPPRDVVKRALTSVHSHFTSEEDLVRMAKGLLKYSVYGRIIKSDRENATIERFYDDCRLLSFAVNDPLFWVQRSICTMNDKQFDISFRFNRPLMVWHDAVRTGTTTRSTTTKPGCC